MHNPWSRRISLSVASVLVTSFAFIGFVEGTAGATQVTTPTTGTATTPTSGAFTGQLSTSGATGAVTYTETSSAHSTQVEVTPGGAITAQSNLPAGSYAVSGGDIDSASATGTWSFTLTVASAQLPPTTGTTTTPASASFTSQLETTGSTGAVTYTETSSAHSTQVQASPSGVITTGTVLPAGAYAVGGGYIDGASNTGTWSFTLSVTTAQALPATGTATTATSGTFTSQLAISGATGAVTYTETSSTHSTQVQVSSSGAVTTGTTLPAGLYTISGGDIDAASNTGTWSFTLNVGTASITQSSPTTATATTTASAAFTSQLVTAGINGSETYSETSNLPNSADVLVSSTGVVSTKGTLAVGTYAVSGTDSDTDGDSGAWSFTLSVIAPGTAALTPPVAPAGTISSQSGTSPISTGTATATNDGTTVNGAGVGALTVAQYGSDPVAAPTFTSTGQYFDVALSAGNSFTSLTLTDCNLGGGNSLEWFNPAANAGSGGWQAVTPTPVFTGGVPPCATATLSAATSPTLAQLVGTVVGTASVTSLAPSPTPTNGYSLVASDGGIFSFGDAVFYGSEGGTRLNKPIVGIAATPTGKGYWLVASDGGIFSFGDAAFYGSEGGTTLNKPIVGIASTPTGKGYWLVASDGGIFSFGDAAFYGSEGGTTLNKPIVGITATPTGKGYWLVASDGGIFSFGDAAFYGSEGGTPLNKPIVGIAATPTGKGYWLVALDGGIFSFGDAAFYGSEGGTPLNEPIVGIS
jgi:hypothetical protein